VTAVLFVRLSAMGDVVQGLGALRALHEVRPEWRLSFVTQTGNLPLLEGLPGLARVVGFDRRGGVAAVARVWRALRAERYDFALDLQGNWKSAMVARLAGARTSLGMAAAWRQEPASRFLLRRLIDGDGSRHPAMVAWQLVRALAPETPFRLPQLVPRADEMERERRALQHVGIAADRPFATIVVTSPADPRALRPEVIDRLTTASAVPVLHLLGPAENGVEARPGVPTLRHEVGEARRLVAMGALVAAAGGEVTAPDQGAVHVLAAAGAKCRVLFGSQDPLQTAPPGVDARVHPAPPSCSPCRKHRCDHADGPVCMQFEPDQGKRVHLPWS
jgi:heptosyltransferase I